MPLYQTTLAEARDVWAAALIKAIGTVTSAWIRMLMRHRKRVHRLISERAVIANAKSSIIHRDANCQESPRYLRFVLANGFLRALRINHPHEREGDTSLTLAHVPLLTRVEMPIVLEKYFKKRAQQFFIEHSCFFRQYFLLVFPSLFASTIER